MRAFPKFVGRLLAAFAVATLTLTGGACVLIYSPPDGGGGGNGDPDPEPLHVQVLWQLNLDRSAINMIPTYETIVAATGAAMLVNPGRPLIVDELGVMALDRTTANGPRLVYGEVSGNIIGGLLDGVVPDPAMPPNTRPLGHVLRAVAMSDFLSPPEADRAEHRNLADLGRNLATASVYRADGTDAFGRALFAEPKDGFIVLTINHLRRPCALGQSKCDVNGQNPVDLFSAEVGEGAAWLRFAGDAQLPARKIVHVTFATAEGVDDDQFFTACTNVPGFPLGVVDLMEPSPSLYWSPFTSSLNARIPGGALQKDLCAMMGLSAALEIPQIVAHLSNQLAKP